MKQKIVLHLPLVFIGLYVVVQIAILSSLFFLHSLVGLFLLYATSWPTVPIMYSWVSKGYFTNIQDTTLANPGFIALCLLFLATTLVHIFILYLIGAGLRKILTDKNPETI